MTWIDDALDEVVSTGDWWARWARAMKATDDLMDRCYRLHVKQGLSVGLVRELFHARDVGLVAQCEKLAPDSIDSLNREYQSRQDS